MKETELTLVFTKEREVPKYKYFPWVKTWESTSVMIRGRVSLSSIYHLEESFNENGELYVNCCNIYIQDLGLRTVNLSFDEMKELLDESKEIGFRSDS